MSEYDVKRGGAQRVHTEGRSLCWIWVKVLRGRIWAVHLSLGPPLWLKPDVRVKRYSGITERRVGWGLVAVQVATRPAKGARSAEQVEVGPESHRRNYGAVTGLNRKGER